MIHASHVNRIEEKRIKRMKKILKIFAIYLLSKLISIFIVYVWLLIDKTDYGLGGGVVMFFVFISSSWILSIVFAYLIEKKQRLNLIALTIIITLLLDSIVLPFGLYKVISYFTLLKYNNFNYTPGVYIVK